MVAFMFPDNRLFVAGDAILLHNDKSLWFITLSSSLWTQLVKNKAIINNIYLLTPSVQDALHTSSSISTIFVS